MHDDHLKQWLSSWESPRRRKVLRYLEAAHIYVHTHGNLADVPLQATVRIERDNVRLGAWLDRVRRGQHDLDTETREDLTRLGMRWEPRRVVSVRQYLRAARVFADTYGSIASITQRTTVDMDGMEVRLGAWLDRVRAGRNRIDEDTRAALTALGMRWDVATRPRREDFLRAAREFAAAQGSLATVRYDTVVQVDGTGIRLGNWLTHVRGGGTSVPPDVRATLTSLGMRWHPLPSGKDSHVSAASSGEEQMPTCH